MSNKFHFRICALGKSIGQKRQTDMFGAGGRDILAGWEKPEGLKQTIELNLTQFDHLKIGSGTKTN